MIDAFGRAILRNAWWIGCLNLLVATVILCWTLLLSPRMARADDGCGEDGCPQNCVCCGGSCVQVE